MEKRYWLIIIIVVLATIVSPWILGGPLFTSAPVKLPPGELPGTGTGSGTHPTCPDQSPMACPFAEERETCCVIPCHPDGPTVFPPKEGFDCGASEVPECLGTDYEGERPFDCDDRAFLCKLLSDLNGYNSCQILIVWNSIPGDDTSAVSHVLNIVEFPLPEGAPEGSHHYCLVEPREPAGEQVIEPCWIQLDDDVPTPPGDIQSSYCETYGITDDQCLKEIEVWCEPRHYWGNEPGEKCFLADFDTCELVEEGSDFCTIHYLSLIHI